MPQVKIEGFMLRKKLLLLVSKGMTRGYLPYISGIWGLEAMPYIVSKVLFTSICDFVFFNFVILPLISLNKSLISIRNMSGHDNEKSYRVFRLISHAIRLCFYSFYRILLSLYLFCSCYPNSLEFWKPHEKGEE